MSRNLIAFLIQTLYTAICGLCQLQKTLLGEIDSIILKMDNSFSLQLGQRISNNRKKSGLTQKQLAKKLGISQQLMANYELGQRRIHASILFQIAAILQIRIESLTEVKKKSKPGPAPKLQQRLELIQQLPAIKQKMVLEFLDSFLQQKTQNK